MTPINGRHFLFGVTNDGFFEEDLVPDFDYSLRKLVTSASPSHVSLGLT
jgi:hypothetical protein